MTLIRLHKIHTAPRPPYVEPRLTNDVAEM